MSEARQALGLADEGSAEEQIERVARELSFGQYERARELCDEAIDRLAAGAEAIGPLLYFRGLARQDDGCVEDFEAALVALVEHPDPSWEAGVRLALADERRAEAPAVARDHYARAVALFARSAQPTREAQARLRWARLELDAGWRSRARAFAVEALTVLRPLMLREARRLEVLAMELLADTAPSAHEALPLLEEAVAAAERLDLGARRKALSQKLLALRSRQGPFR